MPDHFWEEVVELISTGLGFPAFFNDEVVYRAKIYAGVEPKDVWQYGIVGCVEPSIGGLEYSNTEQMRVNWAIILGMMLDADDYTLSLHHRRDLESIGTFSEFYEWYKQELTHFTKLSMEACDLLDSTYGLAWPAPFLSALTQDCVLKGRDITQGALKYSFSSVNGCGMADAVDSLCAIEELVFNKKLLTLKELGKILKHDFGDHEIERIMAVRLKDKFGNDMPKTNAVMKDLTDCFVDTITKTRNLYGHTFQAGLYSVDAHAVMGAATGALPSGRRKGLSLANALSPCQGVDTRGPTSVMCSAASVDMSRLGNGMVLDLKFTPDFLESDDHREKLRDLIRGYFKLGGMEVQFNIVRRETLIAAQKEPENYQNLIVRVSGFSAYFTTLDKVLQDEIIARTEYAAS
jgi:formate C-acetyltransferase